MQDARTAQQILEAIELLGELLWDRFGDQISQLYRQERQYQPCRDDPLDPFGEPF